MMLFRNLVEHFSRNRVLKKRLPRDFGRVPFLASPDAALSYWKSGVKSDLFDLAREFVVPGSVVWDVGANVGLFTFAAAHRAGPSGRVVAIEADLWLAGLLNRSARMQPPTSAPVQVLPVAASDSSKIAAFCIANRSRASNFLEEAVGSSQTGGVRSTTHVVTITLDWLLEQGPAPNVVKIDVEGAELSVLKGGLRVIAEARPVILCEVRQAKDVVTGLLIDHGYTLYDWDSPTRSKVDLACYNTLALPPDWAAAGELNSGRMVAGNAPLRA
jgi:FkbM family methyltransferase